MVHYLRVIFTAFDNKNAIKRHTEPNSITILLGGNEALSLWGAQWTLAVLDRNKLPVAHFPKYYKITLGVWKCIYLLEMSGDH